MSSAIESRLNIVRADLKTKKASLELLRIRNLDGTREWTNDPDDVIELNAHLDYLKTRLGSASIEDNLIVYFILADSGTVMGYQRFDLDKDDPDIWIVSTAFKPSSQGKGVGTLSMSQSIEQLAIDLESEARKLSRVHAWIHPKNMGSIKMCVRSGFVKTDRQELDKAGRIMDLYVRSVLARK